MHALCVHIITVDQHVLLCILRKSADTTIAAAAAATGG
jgi:hypothetical protein